MLKYIAYRLLAAIPVLLGVSLIVFMMLRLVPGDPVQLMFINQARPSPERIAEMRHQLGLDLPLWQQYFHFLGDALHGDLGYSYRSRLPVGPEIAKRLPNTLRLATAALGIAIVIGIPAGVLSATMHGTWLDRILLVVTVVFISVPGFWMGLMIMMLFGVRLGWFPVAGADTLKQLVMPSFTMGIGAAAVLARLTRANLLETMGQDYIRTARAKGLTNSGVIWRHGLRNALIPTVTIIGLMIGGVLSGAFIIETVFAYPGIGELAVKSIQARDFPMVQGIVLFVAACYVGANIVTDILYGYLDPRIKYS